MKRISDARLLRTNEIISTTNQDTALRSVWFVQALQVAEDASCW